MHLVFRISIFILESQISFNTIDDRCNSFHYAKHTTHRHFVVSFLHLLEFQRDGGSKMVKTCIYMSISSLFLLQRMSKQNYIPELFLFLFTNTSTCNQISRIKTSTEDTHQFSLSIMPLLIFKPKRSDFLSLIVFFLHFQRYI